MAFQCFDDPKAIYEQDFCVSALSKDLKGSLKLEENNEKKCQKPECRTLRAVQTLKVRVANTNCDSPPAKPLTGILTATLVSAFDTDGNQRGFHSGDFKWVGTGGLTVAGRMSGVTNVGSHRLPIKNCQKCSDRGIMEGKLCGEVVDAGKSDLKGCQVIAAYRISFDSSAGAISTSVVGTIEGVLVCFCTA